ncbi:hypothetical protein D3C81_966000 [compost metagenome]
MRSTAADHRAEGDDGVELAALGDFLGNQRNLEGARGADDGQLALADAVAHQGVDGALYQAFDDEAVEAANHQGVTAFGGDEGTFDGLQGHDGFQIKSRGASAPRGVIHR